ncbi:MAG: hypothetical protein ACI9NN_001265, partial [Bacteroidia bacterium]
EAFLRLAINSSLFQIKNELGGVLDQIKRVY